MNRVSGADPGPFRFESTAYKMRSTYATNNVASPVVLFDEVLRSTRSVSVSAALPAPAVSVLALAPPLMTSATVPFVDAFSPPVIELALMKVRALFPALVSVSGALPGMVTVVAASAVSVRVSTVVPDSVPPVTALSVRPRV